MQQSTIAIYQPLKWPADLGVAQYHVKCSRPGLDDKKSKPCKCCDKFVKTSNYRWPLRSISKDFKEYGGGIIGFFKLAAYMIVCYLILAVVKSAYHIYLIYLVYGIQQQKGLKNCASFAHHLKFCDVNTIYTILNENNMTSLSQAFEALELISFFFMILMGIGMKIYLQHVKHKDVMVQKKVYGNFSLLLRNIPPFYQAQFIKKQMESIHDSIKITQIFYLSAMSDFDDKYQKLFDLYFEIEYVKDQMQRQIDKDKNKILFDNMNAQYIELYEDVQKRAEKLNYPTGRAIVMFNNRRSRDMVYRKLKIGNYDRFKFQLLHLFGLNSLKMRYFADNIQQPYEIQWKYIGQSARHKTKVSVQALLISVIYMIACFAILYYPQIKIDQIKALAPGFGTLLSIIISIVLIILSISYRLILIALIPKRKPDTRFEQSFFIIVVTVLFHIFFYIIIPVIFYQVTPIKKSTKLKQFFTNLLIYSIIMFLLAIIDIRYQIFRGRVKKIIKKHGWQKLCQMRLHELLNYPSFPIQFKMMVIYNIWSFNSFYIFQIPYAMVIYLFDMAIIFCLDKKNLYRHYKMQHYQSIDLQIKFQNLYIFVFFVCVCGGYAISVFYTWQYYLIILVFILANLINFGLDVFYDKYYHKNQNLPIQQSSTIHQVLRTQTLRKTFLIRTEQRQIIQQNAVDFGDVQSERTSRTLSSIQFNHGYKQAYDKYLQKFKNKKVKNLLLVKYLNLKQQFDGLIKRKQAPLNQKRQSQLTDLRIQREQKQKYQQQQRQNQKKIMDDISNDDASRKRSKKILSDIAENQDDI